MRTFQWPSHNVSRTNLCQRELATCVPVHGFQECPGGLVLPHVLWWTNKHFFLSRCMEECHRHIPQAEATAMTTRYSSRQNETHCCKWWCGRKHVFAFACSSDLIDHQSRPHQSSSLLSVQPSIVPDSLATGLVLADLFIHFKLQHALHLSLSSSFHLSLIQPPVQCKCHTPSCCPQQASPSQSQEHLAHTTH